MTFHSIKKGDPPPPGSHWVEVTRGAVAFFAVDVWMNGEDEKLGPFPEPWDKAGGYRRTKLEAAREAYQFAQAKDLPYWLPDFTEAQLKGEEPLEAAEGETS